MTYVATLIANPETAPLSADIIKEVASNLQAEGQEILASDQAVDLYFTKESTAFEALWKTCQAQQVDLVMQPRLGRKKQILIADMDSTMIQQECIDELAVEAGIGEQVAEITARAMNGEIDFEGAIKERVGALKGLDIGAIGRVLENRITYTPGGQELVGTMRANGGYAALVSGGFTDFTSAVAEKLGFDENRANTLINSDGALTGEVGLPILGRDAKVSALEEIAARLGSTPENAIAVGDGANDLGMLHLAGTGVALHAKPSVAAEVSTRVNFGDLSALLFIQGYAKDDWVSQA